MCYSSGTLEQGEERQGFVYLQCLQISHPCIIIYAIQQGGGRGDLSGTTDSARSLRKLKTIISQSDQPLVFHTLLICVYHRQTKVQRGATGFYLGHDRVGVPTGLT